ncbi:MAG: GTPase [Planctomycetota bacterium]
MQHSSEPPTICACATGIGGAAALLRLSGAHASTIAAAAGLAVRLEGWRRHTGCWRLSAGECPCEACFYPAGRSFTGEDLIEILVPGSAAVVDAGLAALRAAGAQAAGPGEFSRRAYANGVIDLDQASAILAVARAGDEDALQRAVQRLQGALAAELEPARRRLIELRAAVEAGLDFIEEEDVAAYDPVALRAECAAVRAIVARWCRAADDLGREPTVVLSGAANAGKSALFTALTGHQALVSSTPGTTRDWLAAPWRLPGRTVRLIDTPGLLATATGPDRSAQREARALLDRADLVLICLAPDASVEPPRLVAPVLRVATKCDLGSAAPGVQIALSAHARTGLVELAELVERQLGGTADADPEQQRRLAAVVALLSGLEQQLPSDELLAAELERATTLLDELLGASTPDAVLDAIFARFCIGK